MLSRSRGFSLGAVVLCTFGGIMVALAVSWLRPWQFEATTVIAFTPRPEVVGYGFFTTECEVLTSGNVLANAMVRVSGRQWASGADREKALDETRALVSFYRTDEEKRTLVTLRVRQNSPERAREVSDAILREFAGYLAESMNRESEASLAELKKQVAEQEKSVEEARKKLLEVAKDLPEALTDAPPAAHAPPKPPMSREEIEKAGRALAEENAPPIRRISLLQPPEASWLPVRPRLWLVVAVGGLGGLAARALVARLRDRRGGNGAAAM
ncbi:MAG: hypothetical protein J0M04_23690 [Verrucomicrobia bacterium]|nr:hypothetical protein [Verrucomicrobiota bacterium]